MDQPKSVQMPNECTVEQALEEIGLCAANIPQLIENKSVAVFGVTAIKGQVLHEGDRLELLDDLRFDPMNSRRRRAEHKKAQSKG